MPKLKKEMQQERRASQGMQSLLLEKISICILNVGHLQYWDVDFLADFLQTKLLKQNFIPKTLMQNHKARVESLRLIKIKQKQKWILYGKKNNNLFHRYLTLSLAELLILNRRYISGNIKILSLSQRRVMTVFA